MLKSCGPNSCVLADTLVATFYWCNRLQVNSTFGITQSHLLSGKSSATPQGADLKFPLNVCVVFSATFLLCIPTGANSHFMPFFSVAFSFFLIFLYPKCVFLGNSSFFNLSIIFLYVYTIDSFILFFIGSDNTVLPLIPHIIMMYFCPCDYVIRNFPV